MATFRTQDDWHRYYVTEGFIVGEMQCRECGFKAAVALHPETTEATKKILECAKCGKQRSSFLVLPTPAKQ